MISLVRHPVAMLVLALIVGAVAATVLLTVATVGGPSTALPSTAGASSTPEAVAPLPSEDEIDSGHDRDPDTCPEHTTLVSSVSALHQALALAAPGDVIALEPGRYVGSFVAATSGSPGSPITLCGPPSAVLDGGAIDNGYVFHLKSASYWHLIGFTVTNGQKGVMTDASLGSVIEALTVTEIGDEGIHLRSGSSDNVVTGNTISRTGLRNPKFGEGVYVGSAESNWCDISNCEPDRSDRNLIEGNVIFETTAESVDIKEGTAGGVVRGNRFDGASLAEEDADSWVDVKGNGWLIESNVGQNSPRDGFQTHEIVDGWGTQNVFRANTAKVNGPGFGFSLTPVRGNVVECSNTASNAGEGMSNVPCIG